MDLETMLLILIFSWINIFSLRQFRAFPRLPHIPYWPIKWCSSIYIGSLSVLFYQMIQSRSFFSVLCCHFKYMPLSPLIFVLKIHLQVRLKLILNLGWDTCETELFYFIADFSTTLNANATWWHVNITVVLQQFNVCIVVYHSNMCVNV